MVAKAMEIVAGKSAAKLYDENLFQPLEFGEVRMGNASSGGEFTGMELGVLAQWMVNRPRNVQSVKPKLVARSRERSILSSSS